MHLAHIIMILFSNLFLFNYINDSLTTIYVYKMENDEIVNFCKICSRGAARNRSNNRDTTFSKVQKSASGGATRAKIGNLLEKFKTEMLSSFASQIDTLQIQKKQVEAEADMSIFCSK